MKRVCFFLYGVCCYLLFLATYAALACFVGNLVIPRSIDSPQTESPSGFAINLVLIGLFGLQHSVMARPGFKKVWTRVVPEPIERSTFVFISCAILLLLMWQWRSLPAVVWDVHHPLGRAILWGLFAGGWVAVPAVSLLINHFDLFGTRQVWLHLKGKAYTALPFRTPLVYRLVRHPLYVGFLIAFWATPTMTVGHLLFAGGMSLYILIGACFEERDLTEQHGESYVAYKQQVPMFVPRPYPAAAKDQAEPLPAGPVKSVQA